MKIDRAVGPVSNWKRVLEGFKGCIGRGNGKENGIYYIGVIGIYSLLARHQERRHATTNNQLNQSEIMEERSDGAARLGRDMKPGALMDRFGVLWRHSRTAHC